MFYLSLLYLSWLFVIRFCHAVSEWPLYSSSLPWAGLLQTPWWGGFTSACVILTKDRQHRQFLESLEPLLLLKMELFESSCLSSLQIHYEERQKNGLLLFLPCPSREWGLQQLSPISRLKRWTNVTFLTSFFIIFFSICVFHMLIIVSRRPNFICSSDSGTKRASAGLEARENGWYLLRCQTPRGTYVFRTESHR